MRSFYLLALVLLLVATLFPIAADAQHQGGGRDPYSQDPGDGCLGPDDPFCDSGDGDGNDPGPCNSCEYDAHYETSNGQWRPYYICEATGASFSDPTYANCDEGFDRCSTSNPCSIA